MKRLKRKTETPRHPEKVLSHPLYGDIPLIREYGADPSGKPSPYFWWKPDPTFKPPLPPQALPGDISKQAYCSACHLPKYFYVDEEKRCVQCGQLFTFSASEQKYWYETLKFNFHSKAIRCPTCRRQRRTAGVWQHQLGEAIRLAQEYPDDPSALLTLAQTIAEYFQQFKAGNLDRAIAAARKAVKIDHSRYEGIYWEAVCQEAAGRIEKARRLYQEFIQAVSGNARYRILLKEARARQNALPADP